MGNDGSSDSGSNNSSNDNSRCYGEGAPGLNEVCYNAGSDQTKGNSNPDPIGEGLQAVICSTNEAARDCYNQGASDSTKGK
jgi:hypothetical protein